MGKIKDFIEDTTTKCFLCDKEIKRNKNKKISEGLISEGLCWDCIKKKIR